MSARDLTIETYREIFVAAEAGEARGGRDARSNVPAPLAASRRASWPLPACTSGTDPAAAYPATRSRASADPSGRVTIRSCPAATSATVAPGRRRAKAWARLGGTMRSSVATT
jgi:hypothetical protein